MKNIETVLSRFIVLWMLIITGGLFYISLNDNNNNQLFNVGPNSSLYILGINIDNGLKYSVVVISCFINSGIRTINNTVLRAWIINVVQDPKTKEVVHNNIAYEISYVNSVYTWVDFFMYMNILLSQIDMLLIEILADVIMTSALTRHYLKLKEKEVDIESGI